MTNPDDFRLPLACPFCGRLNNAHHAVCEPAVPVTGDCAVCWGCDNVFVYDGAAAVRRPTVEEQAEIDADPDIALARAVRRESDNPLDAVALTREIRREEGGEP